ncbi:lipase family protein [Pseudomonadota bacterium]
MHTLKPFDAAKAADICYDAKVSLTNAQDGIAGVPGLSENFNFGDMTGFSGRSGAFFKVKSGFGFVAKGSGKGYGNDYLVAIRGTAGVADGLTDANIGLQVSGTGKIVHAGFNRVFNDIVGHLDSRIPSGSNIHFCGHSLGGALATLGADWAVNKKGCKAKVYTFGSPRVGFKPFADRLSAGVGGENIFRVHRSTDMVPMVPIWPFVHVPQPGRSYKLENEGFYSPKDAHSIENYVDSVLGLEWASLIAPESVMNTQDASVEVLSLSGLKTLGVTALSMIGRAIAFILKAAGIIFQGGFIAGISILDMLSLALEKAYKVSKEIAGWVRILIEKIASLVGIVVGKTVDITVSLIGFVFNTMMRAIRSAVRFAMLGV